MSQADKSHQGPQMNAMNMGMPGMGGPVGVPNMNNGQASQAPNEKAMLNTYIYDYFLKHHMFDCAQAILREGDVMTNPSRRTSPSRRPQKHDSDGNIMTNGMDDAMENADGSGPRKTEDGEDAKPEFPLPNVQGCPQGCFLFDWWVLFWDIFGVRTNTKPGTLQATQYLQSTQQAQRIRQQQQEQMMLRQLGNPQQAGLLQGQVPSSVMNPGPGYQNPMLRQQFPNGAMLGQEVMAGGMGPDGKQHLVRQAMLNNNNKRAGPPAQQLTALQKQQMMQQAQRDQDVDMNGQQPRPQSPAGSQAAASPGGGKRRNLGNGDYQEVGPATRVQMPTGAPPSAQANQAHQILLANGIDPSRLTPQQFAAFQVQNPGTQQRSIQLYAQSLAQHAQHQRTVLQQGMPKGIPHVQGNPAANNGSPMIPHNPEGTPMSMIPEFYGAAGNMKNLGQPGSGNHALQDYQMQLMLLEQQNKKRLLMARQEQDSLQGRAEQGQNFSGMSPQGGRAAPSPQPPGDMKRGTPKMNPQAGPGSPLPDGQMSGQQQRGSPATSMPGFNGQVPLDAQFYPNKLGEMLGGANGGPMPNNAMMRPPGAHVNFNGQMNTQQLQEQVMNPNLRQQAAGRGQPISGNVWPHNPGMQNATQALMQAQAQQAAHAAQAAQAQAQAQANVQQAQNAPTPGQPRPANHTNMPPPSAPATQANGRAPSSPSVNNQQPPTPTQANKAAPKRKDAKERKKVNAAPVQAHATPSSEPPTPTNPTTPGGNGAQNAQPTQQPQAPAPPPSMSQPDQMPVFNGLSEDGNIFGEFGGESGNDTLLDNFDFDSFLNNPDEGGTVGGIFDPSGFPFPDPVETGAGDS